MSTAYWAEIKRHHPKFEKYHDYLDSSILIGGSSLIMGALKCRQLHKEPIITSQLGWLRFKHRIILRRKSYLIQLPKQKKHMGEINAFLL